MTVTHDNEYDKVPFATATVIPDPNTTTNLPPPPPPTAPVVTAMHAPTPTAPVATAAHNNAPFHVRNTMGRSPVQFNNCPFCSRSGVTKVRDELDARSWLFVAVLCFTGLWPCACLPCCCKNMQTTEQRCRHCNNVVGRVRAFE